MGNLANTGVAQSMLAMLIQAGARLRIGTQALYGSLETTSPAYTAYKASLGVKDNASIDFGKVSELGIDIGATVEAFDAVNERQPSIYIVTEERCMVNVGITQFDPQIFQVLLHHGVAYKWTSPNIEYLITFGGVCGIKNRPLQLDVANIACQLPGSANADLGITGIIFNVYDAISMSGLKWDALNAKALNTMTAEFNGRPVNGLALGNLTGNIYVY